MGENSKMIVIWLAVLALVVGGAAWYLSMDDSEETETTETSQVENTEQTDEASEAEASNTIVDLAVATPSLSTLVTAVQAAELVDTLSSEGPFTVFAPTDEAFAALPEGTLDTLLDPANIEDLQAVLTYHVVSGAVLSSDLSDGQVIETVQGGTLTVVINDEGVFLEDAAGGLSQVVTADVEASNGVVHIVDAVLLQ